MNKSVLTMRGCTTMHSRVHSGCNATRWQSTHWSIPVGLLMLIIALVGCSRQSKPVSSTSGVDFITVEMWASSDCVQPGETVVLRATATNKGSRVEVIELRDRPVLDIVVGDRDRVFRRWSDSKPLTTDLTRLELGPGESKTIEMGWVPDPSIQGAVAVSAHFTYSAKFPPQLPGFTIGVKYCTGSLGP
ncbi:MAG: hypothetical protein HY782_06370 [Chloroflexi bacterium]|nr:hypothetical protein [Chloroflexota bacterium]